MRPIFYLSLPLLLPLLLPLTASAQQYGRHHSPNMSAAPAATAAPATSGYSQGPGDAAPDASGRSVNAWINLQEGGTEAAPDPTPMPGVIASKVYKRYVDSFSHPIPERFERQSLGLSGGGS